MKKRSFKLFFQKQSGMIKNQILEISGDKRKIKMFREYRLKEYPKSIYYIGLAEDDNSKDSLVLFSFNQHGVLLPVCSFIKQNGSLWLEPASDALSVIDFRSGENIDITAMGILTAEVDIYFNF